MTIEQRVQILEDNYKSLYNAFIQSQKNNVGQVAKTDSTANGLSVTDENVGKNSADIDYVAMMTDVELPE